MSFVGTRPEVTKYVKKYTKEMRAALLYVTESVKQLRKREKKLLDIEKISYMYYNGTVTKNAHNV